MNKKCIAMSYPFKGYMIGATQTLHIYLGNSIVVYPYPNLMKKIELRNQLSKLRF
jgi:hypothetical protein